MANQRQQMAQERATQPPAPPPPPGGHLALQDRDILESVLSHVPLPDLVPATHVSISWKRSVLASLRYSNPPKPWLLLHRQSTRPPYPVSTHAYDPRSHVWLDVSHVQQPSPNALPLIRSSHSTLLYALTPSGISFSFDPLHLTWHRADPPRVWRVEPVVAVVGGRYVVVAGGACDFEDDPLVVEVYDVEAGRWDTCQSMPGSLRDCPSSTCLSVAVVGERMLVLEKSTGIACAFDPRAKLWDGPYRLCPEGGHLCCCLVGESDGRLILVGMIGYSDDRGSIEAVKLWELNDMSSRVRPQIGEMPGPLVERLRGDGEQSFGIVSSMSTCFMDGWVYLVNSLSPDEVFFCEIRADGTCRWGSARNDIVTRDDSLLKERLLLTCSRVGLGDLEKAMVCEGRKFTVRK